MDTLCERYSGIRLQAKATKAKLTEMTEVIWSRFGLMFEEAGEEKYFLDDCRRTGEDYLKALIFDALSQGEVHIVGTKESAVGFVVFREVIPGRSATWEAFAFPRFRGTRLARQIAGELLAYAFKPLPEGLGLIKLKAFASSQNRPSLRACACLGFQLTGVSPVDGLFQGQLTDMVALERVNLEDLERVRGHVPF